VNPQIKQSYGVDSMVQTAEHVAKEQGVSREDQDAFAWRSQDRAARAQGFFAEEIVPVTGIVDRDEHPRPETTMEALRLLVPVDGKGTVTAGNASGINDGAAAMLLASESAASKQNLQPRARILGMATAGVAPRVMGMGPVPATQKLLQRLTLRIEDFDSIEINEAFASQALACLRKLGVADDAPHVNPNGGAIALGHPLGMSGARLIMTAVHQLERSNGRRALATMCVGVGQGVALAVERI
jgi:3-oxoadipyl-CoA thiolase